MIKLIIDNELDYLGNDEEEDSRPYNKDFEYDREALKDGSEYLFNSLKEVNKFINDHEVHFTDNIVETFDCWDWHEIDLNLDISEQEDNLLIYSISTHPEWRD